jgi:hypothetical protein
MSLALDVFQGMMRTSEGRMLAAATGVGALAGLGGMGAVRQQRRDKGQRVGALTGLGTAMSGGMAGIAMGGTLGARFGWAGAIGGAVAGGALSAATAILPTKLNPNSRAAAFGGAVAQTAIGSAGTSLLAVGLARGSLARRAYVQALEALSVDGRHGATLLADVRQMHGEAMGKALDFARQRGDAHSNITAARMSNLGFNPLTGGINVPLGGGGSEGWGMAYAGGNIGMARPGADATLGQRLKYHAMKAWQAGAGAPELEQMVVDAGDLRSITGGQMAKAYVKDTLEGMPIGVAFAGIGAMFWKPPQSGEGAARR